MKKTCRIIVVLFAAIVVIFVGVVAITGYQCCNSPADESFARFANPQPSNNAIALAAPRDSISVYSVALRCPLVTGLGCGSESKRKMKVLEANSLVKGTWLNHSGASLAILWAEGAGREERSRTVAAGFHSDQPVAELAGEARDGALADFFTGFGWCSSDAVDALSGQEADAVATRWVRKISSIIPLPKSAREKLQARLADEMRCRFVND